MNPYQDIDPLNFHQPLCQTYLQVLFVKLSQMELYQPKMEQYLLGLSQHNKPQHHLNFHTSKISTEPLFFHFQVQHHLE